LPAPAQLHLFLLVGQSNMAGRGEVEPSDRQPIANVWAMNAAGAWVPATDPLHWDKPSAGVGLARTFALHYLQSHPGVSVGFIPAAVGGSPISSWAPGAYYEETKSHPYDDALGRARTALAHGTLTGILWHQGESDRSAELAPRYERALSELIARFRSDLKAPQVPFLIGQLGQFAGAPWDEHARSIDRAQRQVAGSVPLCAFVPSDGLAAKPDNLHFDAPALREFGRRYAAVFAELTRSGAPTEPRAAAASPAQLLRSTQSSAATHSERDYFVYLPAGYADDPRRRWPVMLFLHGDGSRGDAKGELDYLLRNGPLYEAWVQKRDLPFIIIAPQLPTYGREATVEFLKKRTRQDIPVRLPDGVPERPQELATPEAMTGAIGEELPSASTGYGPELGWPELEVDLLALLDEALQTRRGDPTRVYLTGLSYGGFGTWYLASKHPERFAAIVPIVGYGHPELMPAIAAAKLPVWCFAGGRDGSVRAKNFYAGLQRLEALGAPELRFTIVADMGHDVWARVYAGRDVYAWLLAHTRSASPSAAK